MKSLVYTKYGSNHLKETGVSADAFIQIAMQLATYRLFDNKQAATYQATQTRSFLHGRTETTRTVSTASNDFVRAMNDEGSDHEHLMSLFKEATASHLRYIGKAAKGQGVDRHFFGLSQMIKNEKEQPDLFSHPLFNKSKYWRVSTSALPYTP